MPAAFENIPDYLLKVSISTFTQLIYLLGPLILLAVIMQLVARQTEKLSYNLLGQKTYLVLFGWLGTAIHELGHAFFAILFGHRITEMVLFSPNKKDGTLGHVSHTYNSKSIYQNIGNFFIGIGPILFGSLALFLITWLLFGLNFNNINQADFNSGSLSSIESFKLSIINIKDSVLNYINYLLTTPETVLWKVILSVYLLYSIGSSITLSASDVKSAFLGFIFLILTIFVFNLSTLWIGDFADKIFLKAGNYFSILYFLIILSLITNIIFLIILLVITLIKMVFSSR
jgi:hypothetical protein